MIVGRAGQVACVGVVFLSTFGEANGRAETAPLMVKLDYTAGPGCPGAADFRTVVITRLGYDPFVDRAADHVLVTVEPRAAVTDGRIEWRDSTGRWTGDQTFPSVSIDCPGLARAMAFALVVQIQLLARASAGSRDAEATPSPSAPAPVVKPPATPKASDEAPAAPAVTQAPASPAGGPRPVLAMGAGPAVGLGMSSAPVFLGRLFGTVAWQRVSIEIAAAASLPSTTRRADGAGFTQQHVLGSAAACATATRWNMCLVAGAGEARMAGENIDRPASASVPLLQAGARLGFVQHLGRRAFLSAHADGLVNVIRWTGRLDQVPVWTAPRFAAALGVDGGVQFP